MTEFYKMNNVKLFANNLNNMPAFSLGKIILELFICFLKWGQQSQVKSITLILLFGVHSELLCWTVQGLSCRFDRLWGSVLHERNTFFVKSIMKYYFQERVIYENVKQVSLGQMVAELWLFYFKNLLQILTLAYTRQSSIY